MSKCHHCGKEYTVDEFGEPACCDDAAAEWICFNDDYDRQMAEESEEDDAHDDRVRD